MLASLTADFGEWSAASDDPPLDKHHSQIERVTRELAAAAAEVAGLLEGPAVAARAEVETRVLDLHHLWDFFRGKLALRYVPWYAPFLATADDLAWTCYRTARDAAGPAAGKGPAADLVRLREPPLVFPFDPKAVT